MCPLYGPHNVEDSGIFTVGKSSFLWLHAPLSSFHKNERGSAYKTASSDKTSVVVVSAIYRC